MTPKREAYLAKCGKREKYLRKEIKDYKREIKAIKSALQTGYDSEFNLGCLKFRKLWLTMCRHELARLKGMDRVVMPKVKFSVPQIREWGHTGRKSYYATCKCGNDTLYSGNDERYCPNCGRRILWEKVK